MSSDQNAITITRHFNASPQAVFDQWLDPDALRDWFTPQTYSGLSASADAMAGGRWQVDYETTEGERISESGTFQEIEPARKLVMTLSSSFMKGAPELSVTVTFAAENGGTLMRFHQAGFADAATRDGVKEGWEGCFDKLEARLGNGRDEAEIRKLFNDWFDASERKDLDASMAPIAKTIVSYEHSTPLEVRDIAALRKECQKGFEQSGPEFRWDIPDLEIIVRGDIAVTWGLNRMADYENGKLKSAMWSRGTRVFQRLDGRWQMIHQHVSFPVDEEGKAAMGLQPE